MIDLSSWNGTQVDFAEVYRKAGQRRVYLKLVQGTTYVNPDYAILRPRALAAGLRVGAYSYVVPLAATPEEAYAFFEAGLPHPLVAGRDLRPAFDCEDPSVTPSAAVGEWIAELAGIATARLGFEPVVYGSAWWLAACDLKAQPGALWLAYYNIDDGKDHVATDTPSPWATFAAQQFTDRATVLGVDGLCDLSHVADGALIDVPYAAVTAA